MISATDVYTRANTAWVFLIIGVLCLLHAFAGPALRWTVNECKKWRRRRTQQPIDLSGYARKTTR